MRWPAPGVYPPGRVWYTGQKAALLRRGRARPAPVYRQDGLVFDFAAPAFWREGEPLTLSPTEQRLLCLLAGVAARTLQDTLWFFTYRFSLLPLAVTLPCFAALGALLPPAFYRAAARRSLVERLRQAE